MRRSRLCPVALACLLVTAGCLGFLGGEPTQSPTDTAPAATPTATATSTPTSSPTATTTPTLTPTPAAGWNPPSLTASGVDSPERFANAHNQTLANTSFTVRYYRAWSGNETIEERTVGVVRYDGNGTVYYNITTTEFGPGSTSSRQIEAWSNGTTAGRVITTSNGTTVEPIPPIVTAPTFSDRIEIYLNSFTTRPTGWSRLGGERIVRVSGPRLARSQLPSERSVDELAFQLGFVEIESGSLSADLAEGALRRYRVTLAGRGQSESAVMTEELSFTAIGTTTISRPEWVENASRGADNESRAG